MFLVFFFFKWDLVEKIENPHHWKCNFISYKKISNFQDFEEFDEANIFLKFGGPLWEPLVWSPFYVGRGGGEVGQLRTTSMDPNSAGQFLTLWRTCSSSSLWKTGFRVNQVLIPIPVLHISGTQDPVPGPVLFLTNKGATGWVGGGAFLHLAYIYFNWLAYSWNLWWICGD